MQQSQSASAGRIFKPSLFVFRFSLEGGHENRPSVVIGGDERKICRVGMFPLTGQQVFFCNPDTNFHGCVKCTVDGRLQDYDFPFFDRVEEMKLIDGSGDTHSVGMPRSGNGRSNVNHMHQSSPQKIPEPIGVIRQDHFGHFHLRKLARSRGKSLQFTH
jgi:hypothetical protein